MGAYSFGPDTRAPGGGGQDYNGNPIGGGMGAQFNMGGPRLGGGPAPAYGAPPAAGDLYNRAARQAQGPQRGFGPAPIEQNPMELGFGNPRQFNPGGGVMRPAAGNRFRPPMAPGVSPQQVMQQATNVQGGNPLGIGGQLGNPQIGFGPAPIVDPNAPNPLGPEGQQSVVPQQIQNAAMGPGFSGGGKSSGGKSGAF
jgi:hypothetical protein